MKLIILFPVSTLKHLYFISPYIDVEFFYIQGLPIPIVTTWALMRSLYEDTRYVNQQFNSKQIESNLGQSKIQLNIFILLYSCWTTNSNLKIFWIMRAPITIVIVVCSFFLVRFQIFSNIYPIYIHHHLRFHYHH